MFYLWTNMSRTTLRNWIESSLEYEIKFYLYTSNVIFCLNSSVKLYAIITLTTMPLLWVYINFITLQVFQRRADRSVNFYLYWMDYKNGFGPLDHEHWLGNEKIFSLTNQKRYSLRVDLVNSAGNPFFAKYDFFSISNEDSNYRLSVGTYSDGDAGLY